MNLFYLALALHDYHLYQQNPALFDSNAVEDDEPLLSATHERHRGWSWSAYESTQVHAHLIQEQNTPSANKRSRSVGGLS